ncbi:MAG: NifB/NifX family molybdenum-iron cluster-binding protein [Bacteroidota bacterium]|nr:NifB/NifX family molybdenum-iron cluster-binding protein [Bacteroidota bacterium]
MKLRVAFATDDGKMFMKRHFGDAMFYDIYEISERESFFIKRLENTTSEEETQHADVQKAKGISSLLKKDGIHIVVSQVFGPNIKRIKKKFVPLIVKEPVIEQAINAIQQNISVILKEWERGTERKHVILH